MFNPTKGYGFIKPMAGDKDVLCAIRESRRADATAPDCAALHPGYGEIKTAPEPTLPAVLQISPSSRTRPLGHQPQRLGIDAVLDREDPRGQRLRRVVIAHRNRALHHDRTGVGFRNDEMHGGAGNFHAGAQRLAVRDRGRETTAAARDEC